MTVGVSSTDQSLVLRRGSPALTSVSFILVFGLAVLAHWLTQRGAGWFGRELIEYPIWAVCVGLLANLILEVTGVYPRLLAGFRTELFLKTGLVIMGATINFATVTSFGVRGIGQALVMITSVFFFVWWLAGRLGVTGKLRPLLASSLSICGVSAAIASAGAVCAKKEELSYTTALVVLFALPLMLLQPLLAQLLGLSATVAGAWIGGNIDTTAAVVGAGALVSEDAMQVASVVKMAQNALIGVAAFLLAVYWVWRVEAKTPGEAQEGTDAAPRRPQLIDLWRRFPKFVLGFALTSLLATGALTAGWVGKADLAALTPLRNWFLTLAFVSIGLEIRPAGILALGWRPVAVYALGTLFNTAVALAVAWLIFG